MKRVRKTNRDEKPEPTRFGWKDHVQVWGIIGGLFVIVFFFFHFSTSRQQSIAYDNLIAKWTADYHLSKEQARRVRSIEEQFHGSGDPLFRPAHTADETRAHHREMAYVMNPEDGARFFHTMEPGAAPLRPPAAH